MEGGIKFSIVKLIEDVPEHDRGAVIPVSDDVRGHNVGSADPLILQTARTGCQQGSGRERTGSHTVHEGWRPALA
jgi:hypothetical protein